MHGKGNVPILINRLGIKSSAAHRRDLHQIETGCAKYCRRIRPTHGSRTELIDQGEMLGIKGLIVTVTPKEPALELSSDFNPN